MIRILNPFNLHLNQNFRQLKKNHFFVSYIEEITIPSQVTQIGERAFALYKKLRKIEIPNDSKLRKIEKEVFFWDQKLRALQFNLN